MKGIPKISEAITEMLEVFEHPTPSALENQFRLKMFEREAKALAHKDPSHKVTYAASLVLLRKFTEAEKITSAILSEPYVPTPELNNLALLCFSMMGPSSQIGLARCIKNGLHRCHDVTELLILLDLYLMYYRCFLRKPCEIPSKFLDNGAMEEKIIVLDNYCSQLQSTLQRYGVSLETYHGLLEWLYQEIYKRKFIVAQVLTDSVAEYIATEVWVVPTSLDDYVDLSSDFAEKKHELGLPEDVQVYLNRVTDDQYNEPSFAIAPIDKDFIKDLDSLLGIKS